MARRWSARLAKAYVLLLLLYIFAPVLSLVLFSLQSGRIQSLPIEGLTLRWYAEAVANPSFRDGLRTSVVVACLVAPLSTALGFASAHLLCRHPPGHPLCYSALVSMPAFVPLMLSGLVMLMHFEAIGVSGTLFAIVAAHVCYCSPFAFVIIYLSYQRLNIELEMAARNLGARPSAVLLQIVVPQLRPALLAALLLTALVSWDEFVLAFFVGGFTKTLPTVLYSALGTSFDPSLNALGVMVTIVSVAVFLAAVSLLRVSLSKVVER